MVRRVHRRTCLYPGHSRAPHKVTMQPSEADPAIHPELIDAETTPYSGPRSTGEETLPRVGEIIDDKYEITKLIGEGGMGLVFQAFERKRGRSVALKFLHPTALAAPGAMTRFEREASVAATLRGPHIARMIDVGSTAAGVPYLAMELLRGRDLEAELRVRGALPIAEAVDILLQACDAMSVAHASGVIHRDIKPSNIFLADNGAEGRIVKLLDFGVSLTTRSEGPRVTGTSMSVGTPLYMSPEQVRCSKKVDSRTDIWALGVVLFEALVGSPPFEGTSTAAVAAIVADETPSVRTARSEVPAALDAVIARSLAKDVRDRFQTVEALAQALAPFGSGRIRRRTRVRMDELARTWLHWPPARRRLGRHSAQTLREGHPPKRMMVALGCCLLALPAIGFARFDLPHGAAGAPEQRCLDHTLGEANANTVRAAPTPADLTLDDLREGAVMIGEPAADGGVQRTQATPVSSAKPIHLSPTSSLVKEPLYL
jgi:serine/threonine-protein kinase